MTAKNLKKRKIITIKLKIVAKRTPGMKMSILMIRTMRRKRMKKTKTIRSL